MGRFSKRLKTARAKKYVSAQKFAFKMGLDPHAYRKYERGEANPPLETLVRICEDLGITPDGLLLDNNEQPPVAS